MARDRESREKAARQTFSFRLEKDLADLSRLLENLEKFAAAQGVSPLYAQRVALSVDELVTNIIKYGTRGQEMAHIHVWAAVSENTFHIDIEDHGIAFDPFQEAPVPDTTLPLEDRPIGGLGVFLVQSLMSTTHYERTKDRNRITLTRSLPVGEQEDPNEPDR